MGEQRQTTGNQSQAGGPATRDVNQPSPDAAKSKEKDNQIERASSDEGMGRQAKPGSTSDPDPEARLAKPGMDAGELADESGSGASDEDAQRDEPSP